MSQYSRIFYFYECAEQLQEKVDFQETRRAPAACSRDVHRNKAARCTDLFVIIDVRFSVQLGDAQYAL